MANPNVTVIAPKKQFNASAAFATPLAEKRKVAAYARVSTDKDEQETSFAAQVDYYTNYINERHDWELYSIFTDEGISGCNTKNRDGFKQMLADGLAGKFTLLITKSVSRFARNTVDSLTAIRDLKAAGCEVFFEKEGIWSFDGKGELLLTIMSSLAQEEARNISENVTWGQRKRMADGKVSLPYKQFLGYKKGEDGTPSIVEEEAEIVRFIFRLFIEGKTPSAIARQLMDMEIPTPAGKEKWQVSTVRSILGNEKYSGQARLQKVFTTDYLTKSRKKNEGELPSYWVVESHPAIISPEDWEVVQAETARRDSLSRPMGCKSPFSSHIVCGCCGAYFGPKTWGSYKSDKTYRRKIWQCNDKYRLKKYCDTAYVTEEQIGAAFLKAWNEMSGNRENLLDDCKAARDKICDCSELLRQINEAEREIEVVEELSRKLIYEASHTQTNADDFKKKNAAYLARRKERCDKITTLETEIQRRQHTSRLLDKYIRNMKKAPLTLSDFDEKLWAVSIDCVTVHSDGRLIFRFRDGTEITV